MNEPTRLFDADAPEPLKVMIAAARAEQPRAAAFEKTLALTALGGTAGALLLVGPAAKLSAAHGSGISLAALKWAGMGVVVGATTFGVVQLPDLIRGPWTADDVAPAATVAARSGGERRSSGEPAVVTPVPEPAVDEQPLEPPVPAVVPAMPVPPVGPHAVDRARETRSVDPRPEPPSAPDADPLVKEVLLLDAARAAVGGGNLALAEARLSEHRARFPRGKLAPEALYLKLQILERRGDHAGALSVARDLVRRFPDTPPASRARTLIEKQIP